MALQVDGPQEDLLTLYYYSMVPRLADKLLALTGGGTDDLIPAPWEEVPLDG